MAGASKSDSFSEEKGGSPCWFGTRMAWPLEFLPTTARPARRTLDVVVQDILGTQVDRGTLLGLISVRCFLSQPTL